MASCERATAAAPTIHHFVGNTNRETAVATIAVAAASHRIATARPIGCVKALTSMPKPLAVPIEWMTP